MRYRMKNSIAIRTTHDIAAATGTRIGGVSSLFMCPRSLTHQSRKTTPAGSVRQHIPAAGYSGDIPLRNQKDISVIQLSHRNEVTSSPVAI